MGLKNEGIIEIVVVCDAEGNLSSCRLFSRRYDSRCGVGNGSFPAPARRSFRLLRDRGSFDRKLKWNHCIEARPRLVPYWIIRILLTEGVGQPSILPFLSQRLLSYTRKRVFVLRSNGFRGKMSTNRLSAIQSISLSIVNRIVLAPV